MFASMLGPTEVVVLLVLGVLLFGKKLPEVGHSVGRPFSNSNGGSRESKTRSRGCR